MKTQRLAVWWFKSVISGRFLDKFLTLHRMGRRVPVAANSPALQTANTPPHVSQITPTTPDMDGRL
jgi:hypothetical protein